MNTRERIMAAWNGEAVDHVPLTAWCFGLSVPERLQWERDGVPRKHWYSLRMEHIHTLPQPWDLEDDFRRVRAWRSLGVDDVLQVSVPWSAHPEATWKDSRADAGTLDPQYPVLVRDYQTPGGDIRHAVRQTGEDVGAGWVIQPECVPLIEDYNIPRAVEHLISKPEDVVKLQYLYCPPDEDACRWFASRMDEVKTFAERELVPVQAWAGFGMDAVVWFTGTEGAIFLATDAPEAFHRLMEIITQTDLARTELAASTPGVDMVVERGWYSSTAFWSPVLFDEFLFAHIKAQADKTHEYGKKFGYTMTIGAEILGPRLADAGVDVFCFVDPVQDGITPVKAAELLGDRMTLVGGTNAMSLQSDDSVRIEREVREAIEALGPTNRFILHPVDSVFPDTPWSGVEKLLAAWEKYR